MAKKVIGIDLGTNNTRIKSSNSEQLLYDEPTCLIWNKKDKKIVEIGYLAHKLIGKVPLNMELVQPIVSGVISSKFACYSYLKKALETIHLDKSFRRYNVIFSVPSNITEVEKEALLDVASMLKGKNIFLADAAKASAIGSGIDIYSTKGSMLVDIGGSTTNITALTMGKIVISRGSNIAGNSLDEAITRYIRTKHHLLIGNKTSEYIKMKIGTLLSDFDNSLLEVNGKDVITGLPKSIVISTNEISEVLIKVYDNIVNLIIDTLESTPPEIASDIIHSGITISGGGCLLNGTREYFQTKLSLPIHISAYPLESTVNGLIQASQQFIQDYIDANNQ